MKSLVYYAKLLAWAALLWFFSGFVTEAGGKSLNVVWESIAGSTTGQDKCAFEKEADK